MPAVIYLTEYNYLILPKIHEWNTIYLIASGVFHGVITCAFSHDYTCSGSCIRFYANIYVRNTAALEILTDMP